ncbi:MAG TPA: sulfatase [Candidatus Binatia bacterium]|nr:sulfatase [Candidatus Binatia bacterium]
MRPEPSSDDTRRRTHLRYRDRYADAIVAARAVILLLAIAAIGCRDRAPTPTVGPNVLLISIDSLRRDHVGCYGYPLATTPTIDRLATEGVTFRNAVSTTSWTLAAHAALLTGVHDARHGATIPTAVLDESIPTLAEAFRAAGYRTVGLYSGPFLHPHFGLARGFEEYVDCTSYGLEDTRNPANPRVHASSHKDVTNPRLAESFARVVASTDERPFFFFVHMWDVHYDLVPPSPYDRMFSSDPSPPDVDPDFRHDRTFVPGMDERAYRRVIALYDGEIRFTDDTISAMLEQLRGRGRLDDTIVVITSDHGEEFLEHGGKGHRNSLFDEVLAVPLVFWAPARLRPGVAETAASLVDVAPTLARLAGLGDLPGVDGRPLFDASGTVVADARIAVSELRVSARRPKLVAAQRFPDKVIRDVRSGVDSYYDLAADPREQTPRSAADVPRAQPLVAALDRSYAANAGTTASGRKTSPPLAPAMENRLKALGYLD